MSKFINRVFVLFGIDLNQSITAWVLRHWLHFVWLVIALFIFSSSILETIPISLFGGLINRNHGLDLKFSLWSFNVIYADWSAYCSILFSSFKFLAKYLFCFFDDFLFSGCCYLLERFCNVIIYKLGIFLFRHLVHVCCFVGKYHYFTWWLNFL